MRARNNKEHNNNNNSIPLSSRVSNQKSSADETAHSYETEIGSWVCTSRSRRSRRSRYRSLRAYLRGITERRYVRAPLVAAAARCSNQPQPRPPHNNDNYDNNQTRRAARAYLAGSRLTHYLLCQAIVLGASCCQIVVPN